MKGILMKCFTIFCFSVFLFFLLQSCSEGANNTNDNVSPLPLIPVGAIFDVNSAPNQISEAITENGVEVGITIYINDPDVSVTYELLDSANGRFVIEEATGVVLLADYLLLNADLLPKHDINVLAIISDGTVQSKMFEIAVLHMNTPISDVIDIDEKVNDDSQVDALNNTLHTIMVNAFSDDGSSQNKNIDHSVLNNYENDIKIVNKVKSLLDWNDGNGQSMTGWNWLDDVAYGNPGWLLDKEGPLRGGNEFSWGWGPKSFNKGDYGKENTALIDTSNKAPSTSKGGSLFVTETELSKDHRSTWWLWYDGKPLSERGITNSKTDRMSFYLKTEGMNELKDDNGKSSITETFHIGTYLCWNSNEPAYSTGDGCPYEGIGNQHYYHTLSMHSGAWIHVLLDQHPQHRRGEKGTLANNPVWDPHQKNYFEQLNQFYFEIRDQQQIKTSFRVDEIEFFSSLDMREKNQNDESITSLWVGYWKEKDVWEIGFHDESFQEYNDEMNSTFEIRWSTSPINNKNFHNANRIEPMFYGGSNFTGPNSDHLIRRPNGWTSIVWTRFELPNEVEDNFVKVFFAVKDVSKLGEHKGAKWPYNYYDGHNAPTNNIKIIDYYLKAPSD
jgi:hypothetical protein